MKFRQFITNLAVRVAGDAYSALWLRGRESSAADGKLTQPMKQSVWVMRALKEISGPISSMPLEFTDLAAGQPRHRVSGLQKRAGADFADPRLESFWSDPFKALSYDEGIEATCGWLKLKGEAFWILDDTWALPFPDAQAKFGKIIIVRPDSMREIVENGELIGWALKEANGNPVPLLPQNVLQFKFWNPDNKWRGLAEYDAAKIAAETDYLAGKFAANLMRNNGDTGPYVVDKSGNGLNKDQIEQVTSALRLKRNLSLRGEFRPAVLSGNLEVQDAHIATPDANFVAIRLQDRHEVYIAFGVPPSLADIKASYSIGSASDYYRLIWSTCMPLGHKIATGIAGLASRQTGRRLAAYLDWDEHQVLRAVRNERIDSAAKLWDRGISWETANDYLNLGLAEFPGWDVGYLPFNVVATDAAGAPPPPPDQNPDFSENLDEPVGAMIRALRGSGQRSAVRGQKEKDLAVWRAHMAVRQPIIAAFKSRFTKQLMVARAVVLKKIAASDQRSAVSQRAGAAADFLFDLATWKDGLKVALRPVEQHAIGTAVKQLLTEIGKKDDAWTLPPEKALQFVRDRENRLADVADEVHAKIKRTLEDGITAGDSVAQLADRVRGAFNEIGQGRAKTVASTETSAAFGFARHESMTAAGITQRRWLTSGNANVRPTHEAAEGQTVGIEEPFNVGGAELMYPGDEDGPPEEVINCHCVAIPVANEGGGE